MRTAIGCRFKNEGLEFDSAATVNPGKQHKEEIHNEEFYAEYRKCDFHQEHERVTDKINDRFHNGVVALFANAFEKEIRRCGNDLVAELQNVERRDHKDDRKQERRKQNARNDCKSDGDSLELLELKELFYRVGYNAHKCVASSVLRNGFLVLFFARFGFFDFGVRLLKIKLESVALRFLSMLFVHFFFASGLLLIYENRADAVVVLFGLVLSRLSFLRCLLVLRFLFECVFVLIKRIFVLFAAMRTLQKLVFDVVERFPAIGAFDSLVHKRPPV